MKPSRSHAFVLVAVLVVTMLASMVAVSLLFRLRAEETAAAAGSGSEQAWAAAMSGVSEAMRVVSEAPPGSLDWQDAPGIFRERLLVDDGSDRWYFTVYTMGDSERQEIRFGLTDEASKLNINNATEAMLEHLPKMTPYLAQGLLDFLDADDTPRTAGAEQEYYDSLPRPYAVRNGPLSTLGELLLVRGFTPALLYGEDVNLNYQLDPNEDDGDERYPPDNHDGKLDPGWRPFLTVCSYDLNEDNNGIPRTDLNDPQDPFPSGTVTNSLVDYILALRRSKIKLNHAADLLEAKGKFADEKGKEVEMQSGVGKKELAALLDLYTTTINYHLPGLINVNTASARVLQTVPEIDEALAESIVSARRDLRAEQRRTPAWLYEDDLVDAERFKKIAPYLTSRGFQYHFQVVGYGLPSGRYRVLEAMVDLGGFQPAITYLRDITRLGLPFRIETGSEAKENSVARVPHRLSSPSPLKGERAGVRGVTGPAYSKEHRHG